MLFPPDMVEEARRLLDACRAQGLRLATAESCTGGLVSALLTEIPGSSDVFDRGFVTYSNAAKISMLSVPQALIAMHGAVSEEVARAMAEGALHQSEADIAVSITGIAGPGGGTAQKPVGLVCFGLAQRNGPIITDSRRFGDTGRGGIRMASLSYALTLLAPGA